MQNDPEASDGVRTRYETWRTIAAKQTLIILIFGLGFAAHAWRDLYDRYHVVPPIVLGLDADHRVIELTPLDQPRMSNGEIEDWTAEALMKLCKLDWMNWETQLHQAETGFTPSGWAGVQAELARNQIIASLQKNRLIEKCSIRAPARIVRQGLLGVARIYDVVVPVIIEYTGSAEEHNRSQLFNLTAQVLQVPVMPGQPGVAISAVQFDTAKYKPLGG